MIRTTRRSNSKISIFYLILIGFLWLSVSYCAKADNQIEQYFTINNNGSILARSSLREITRIAFDSDITSINAIAGELEYAVTGKDLYLRTSSDKPINFFVSLEGGWIFKVILSAEDIPATQIFVKSKYPAYSAKTKKINQTNKQKMEVFQDVSPFLKKRIEKIISVVLNPKKHIGYEIVPQSKSLKESKNKLRMTLVGIISEDMLLAERISITNKTKENQLVDLNEFMDKRNLAVYLTKTHLLPEEKAILIRIREN